MNIKQKLYAVLSKLGVSNISTTIKATATASSKPDAPSRPAREDPPLLPLPPSPAPCPDPIRYHLHINKRWRLRELVRTVSKPTLLEQESLCCAICHELWEGLTAGEVRLLVGGDEEAVERMMADLKMGVCRKPIMLSCGHFFGGECLVMWLMRNRSCPMCKKVVEMDRYEME